VVEDQDDWKFIRVFGKKVLGEQNWQKVEKRLSIFPAKGNPYRQDIKKLKEQLTAMFRLNLSGNPLKLFVIADWDYHPKKDELTSKLNKKDTNIEFHIWNKAEIENYLLVPEALKRLVQYRNENTNLFTQPFLDQFNLLINESKDIVFDKIGKAIEDYSKAEKKGWDFSRIKHEAQLFLEEKWENNKTGLTDAKEYILPRLKKWLQENGYTQFSDFSLAENLTKQEIAPEVHDLIYKLANFAGISVQKDNS